jgi:hypothetical protein
MVLGVAGCALPGIYREGVKERDAAVSDASQPEPPQAALAEEALDPFKDPKNRNEDFATFQTLIPPAHVFAEWPMPDTSAHSKWKPSYTVSEHVITDNVTKLRWQRVMPKIYPGCTGEYDYVGRKHAVGTGCLWEEAKAYCERPEIAEQLGAGHWRLPTRIELETLIDVSRVNFIDPLFDDFPIDYVWSSSPVPNDIPDGLKLSWNVDFTVGATGDGGRFKAGRARCVSSENDSGGTEQSFDLHRDFLVRDLHTQLEWQASPDSAARDFFEAIAYCEQLESAGGGWHLPSLKELLTLVDTTRWRPAINRHAFGLTRNDRYWTSTQYLDGRDLAYVIDFERGGSHAAGMYADLHYVRCVR